MGFSKKQLQYLKRTINVKNYDEIVDDISIKLYKEIINDINKEIDDQLSCFDNLKWMFDNDYIEFASLMDIDGKHTHDATAMLYYPGSDDERGMVIIDYICGGSEFTNKKDYFEANYDYLNEHWTTFLETVENYE